MQRGVIAMEIDPKLESLLVKAKDLGASDLHLTVGTVPAVRVNNELTRMEGETMLLPEDTRRLLESIMDEEHAETFRRQGEVDFAFGLARIGRFRVNAYRQRGSVAIAVRIMSSSIPRPEELGVPESVIELTGRQAGLVLVTGPTGAGKSTTLAALIQRINETRHCHVLTLEDPIEYLYRHDQSLVDQREIGLDSSSFAAGLRAALREDPDVIMLGEMRDLETISTALTAAETGHLVFSTLHTLGAASTVNRIIDVFPESQKEQIRTQLSMVLESVVSQRLLPKADGSGRMACFEVMHCTSAIRNLIRDNKTFQIPGILQTSRRMGMMSMEDSLADAYQRGLITEQTALQYAQDAGAVRLRMGAR